MKITKRQLKRIIREEKKKLLSENVESSVFDSDATYDIIYEEISNYMMEEGIDFLTVRDAQLIRQAFMAGLNSALQELTE